MYNAKTWGKPDPDLVYETNRWQRYLWREHSNDAAGEVAGIAGDAAAGGFPRYDAFMREVFGRLYTEREQRVETPTDGFGWAEHAHSAANELPEWQRLRDRCKGDQLWAGMAATQVARSVLDALPEPAEPLEDPVQLQHSLEALQAMQEQAPGNNEIDLMVSDAEQALAHAKAQATQHAQQVDSGAIRQALRRACEQAQGSIDGAQDTMDAFGWGDQAGTGGSGGDIAAKRELMKRVGTSDKLAELAKLAGRMRRMAAQKQRSKADLARDEVSDIVQGDDLARLLPSELAKLANPLTRRLFYRDYLERSLLCYELSGKEIQGQGPIIVCVDNSGSMAGAPELWSKAVALALLDVAQKQKRAFALVHFDHGVRMVLEAPRDKAPSPEGVFKAMEFFSGGGTSFSGPMNKALSLIESDAFEKADVVLITDGAADSGGAAEYRRRMEAKGATTYGVQIGGQAGGLEPWADKTFALNDLDIDNPATKELFSI